MNQTGMNQRYNKDCKKHYPALLLTFQNVVPKFLTIVLNHIKDENYQISKCNSEHW